MNEELNILRDISIDINKAGGRVFYVGGYVRDKIMGNESKDIDVEVYNITLIKLKEILSNYGEVSEVGAAFGILIVKGLDIDFAMPRTEKKIGAGHKGFEVSIDPYMSFLKASKRRDITINSIMEDVLIGEIIDCFNGRRDLDKGVIKHIHDDTFVEDALRVLRVCQFSSRLGFSVDKHTLGLCKTINVSELPKERIFEEVKKALLQSTRPSIAFELMMEIGIIDKLFPELYSLSKAEWNLTMRAINEAAEYRDGMSDPLVFMLAALSNKIKDVDYFLIKLIDEKALIKAVIDLTSNYMKPFLIYKESGEAVRRFMVDVINPKDVIMMSIVIRLSEKVKNEGSDYDNLKRFQDWFFNEIEKEEKNLIPLVSGKELLDKGFKQGKELGEALRNAYNLQIEGLNKEEIMKEIII